MHSTYIEESLNSMTLRANTKHESEVENSLNSVSFVKNLSITTSITACARIIQNIRTCLVFVKSATEIVKCFLLKGGNTAPSLLYTIIIEFDYGKIPHLK